jgi:phage shock protein PspC (stress-responsive transcriptional regulator)
MSTSPPHTTTAGLHEPRFERPVEGRMVSGVCAAIERRQGLDIRIVRAIAVVLVLAGGIGLIAYFAGLMLIPAEGHEEPLIREGIDGPERKHVLVLGAAAAIALIGLPDDPLGLFSGAGRTTIAIIALVAVGVLVLRGERDGGGVAVADGDVAYAPGEEPTLVAGGLANGPGSGSGPRRRHGRRRGVAILGAVLLAFAAIGGVLAAIGGDIRWDVALCVATIAIGVLLVAGAPFGGARVLIPLGLLLAVLAGGAAAANLTLKGGVGDHLEHPGFLTAGTTSYHLAAGRLMVDLRDAELPPGVTTVKADVGFGQLVVRAPKGVPVELRGHASAGEVEVVGRDDDGFDAERVVTLPGGTGEARVLRVIGHAGFGQVRMLPATHALPRLGDHGVVRGLPEATR